MSEPLTPEEEATLREYAKHHVRSDVDRLLATLDAARVAPSDGLREALEIIAAPPTVAPDAIGVKARNIARAALATTGDRAASVAPSDGLREAAQALVDEWDAAMVGDMPLNGHYQKQALDRLRAALATTGQPEHSHIWRDGELLLNGCALPHAQPEDTRTADPGGLREALTVEETDRLDDAVGQLAYAIETIGKDHPDTIDYREELLDVIQAIQAQGRPAGAVAARDAGAFAGSQGRRDGGSEAASSTTDQAEAGPGSSLGSLTPEATAPDEEGAKP
jgi:hypothetical protein